MGESSHDWLTLHRVRFDREIRAGTESYDAPAGADCWRFCPSFRLNEKDLPTWESDTWCGLGVFGSRSVAETVFNDPASFLPNAADAVELWHALLLPVAHRGEVKWRVEVESGSAYNSRARLIASEGVW